MSEITHLQPNPRVEPPSNDTASLLVHYRNDFSDLRIVEEYREKSFLKGFAGVGGLWTFLVFFFGVLFGSSLGHVVFGTRHRIPPILRFLTAYIDRCEAAFDLWSCTSFFRDN